MTQSPKISCLNSLRTRILTLDIAPGSDLDEARLSSAYKISRTPLREVLQRLAGEGFITIHDNRGAKVASMDLMRMRVFFQTAPMIYCAIAQQACTQGSAANLSVLKDIQSRFAKAIAANDAQTAAIENHQFHEQIGVMAENPYLVASLNRMLIDHTRLSQTFFDPRSDQETNLVRTACDQHDQMIAAFEVHNEDQAIALTLAHWDLSKDRMERFVRPDPLPLDFADQERMRDAV